MLKRFISSAVHLQKSQLVHPAIFCNSVKFVNNNTFPRFFSKTTFVYNDTQKQPEQQTEKTKETKSETVRPIRYRGTVNRATIVGYVGQDPVQKEVKNDKTATWFSVATTEVVKGNRFTTWHNVVLFDKKAQQAVMDHVKQGMLVWVEGPINQRKIIEDGKVRFLPHQIICKSAKDFKIIRSSRAIEEDDDVEDEEDEDDVETKKD